ncbi:MAG: SUMF1/EgtB/PvdO family nonheme iron enzyme [bacterium]
MLRRLLYLILVLTVLFVYRLFADTPSGTGTGFVVNPNGYLLTCAHVVKGSGKITVTLGDKTLEAAVLRVDETHDIALIQIDAKGLTPLTLGDSNAVEVGQEARAFGFPLSDLLGEDIKVTRGSVSGVSMRDAQKIIQFDAAVNPGNSGGPLVNEKGEAIGIINAKIKDSLAAAVGFAVPVNYAKVLLEKENVSYYYYKTGNAVKMDGPTLVKNVSPSIALINIWEKLPPVIKNPKDGAEMVLVPAGDFLMGSIDDEEFAAGDEKPQHKVNLDSYYIYKTEVTVAQFRKFCNATGRKNMPPKPEWGWIDNQPIVNVNWYDAKAYADWAGLMLPTEAQWEKAARGIDGRIYPWGNDWDETKCANYSNCSGGNDIKKGVHPVGSFSTGASPYGALDMAGNVLEWCGDWYDENYYNDTAIKNPVGPGNGKFRVVRGGSWFNNGLGVVLYRCAFRFCFDKPNIYRNTIGFRCAILVDTIKMTNEIETPSPVIPPKDLSIDLPKQKINPKDGAEMVLVPAGEFLMGSKDDDKEASDSEKPQHKVYLDSYYIYKTEVTVAQFRKFCHATGRKSMPLKPKWGWIDNHPVVNISWYSAKAYADWAGVKLPTEAQWEKAARGTNGRIYPWGNDWDAAKCVNFTNSKGSTKPVGSISTGASPYGCLDMTGNVWEWCNDWYSGDYYKNAPEKNPIGPETGESRVLRGRYWYSYDPYYDYDYYRAAYRDNNPPDNYSPGFSDGVYGFRCASPGP